MAPCLLVVFDQPALWHLDAARGPSTPSLDHLVGAGEQRRGHCRGRAPGGLEIDDERHLGGLDRQIGRLLALEDAVDVAGRAPVLIDRIGPVGDQAALGDEEAKG